MPVPASNLAARSAARPGRRLSPLAFSILLGSFATACGSDSSGSGGTGGGPGTGGVSGGAGGAGRGGAGGSGAGGGAGGSGGAAAGAGGSASGAGGATAGTGGSTSDAGPAEAGAPGDDAAADASSGPEARVDASPSSGAPAPGEYGTRATLLERNSEFAMAALDGKIYVLGGYPSSPTETRPTLQIYDPATNSWKRGANSPVALHHPMIAGVNGKLYSLGGQPNTNLVLEYDPATDAWNNSRARMPTARGGGAAAVIGSKIYVVGARPPGLTPEAVNAFEVYDVATNMWQTLPKLPERFNNRNHLAAAAIDGKVYVAGGRYNECCVGAPRTAALEVFDPAAGTWTAKKDMLRPRGGVAGVAANGCFFVWGGEGNNIGEPNNVFPDHDVYNPKTDTWMAVKPLPIPFHGVTGGAFVDGLIYMPGGGTSSGGSSGTTMHQVYRPAVSCL